MSIKTHTSGLVPILEIKGIGQPLRPVPKAHAEREEKQIAWPGAIKKQEPYCLC